MFRPPLSRLCFALCLLIGCTAPAYAFDLIQAFEAAQRHSAEYAAAQYGYQAEIEQEAQARAPLLPQISANALYQRQPASLSSNTVSHGWGVQASQVLFDRSLWAQYRQGRQAAQQAAAKLQRSGDDLLLQVAQAYCEVLQQQDTWAAIRQEKAAYFRQMQQARAAFEKGAATRVDIEEARAGYDAALAKEITTVSRLELARSTLNNLTGLDSRQIEPVRPGELPDWLKQKENYWQDLAERHNPQWIEQRWAWQQARSSREAAQGSRWPRLTLNGGYQDHHNTQSYGRADQHYRSKGGSITLQLNLPLYDGGQTNSRIRETTARELQQHELLTATERQVRQAVRQAYLDAYGHQYRILAQQRLLDSNRAKLESTRLGRQVGVRSLLEELQAQQAAADAEQQLAQARYGYVLAYVRLLKEAGVLGETARQQQLRRELFAGNPKARRASAPANPAIPATQNLPRQANETTAVFSTSTDAPPPLTNESATGEDISSLQTDKQPSRSAAQRRRHDNRHQHRNINDILLTPNWAVPPTTGK